MIRKANYFSNSVFFILLITGMVTVFTLLFLPLFLSDKAIRSYASSYISKHGDIDIQIEGDIYLTMFPTIRLRAKDITVETANKDIVKRPPLTIRELSLNISYFGLLTGSLPNHIRLNSPVFYVQRMDFRKQRWDLLKQKKKGEILLGEETYIEELWYTLYRICHQGSSSDDITSWRAQAIDTIKKSDMSVSKNRTYFEALTDALCQDDKETRVVYKNWDFFLKDHAYSALVDKTSEEDPWAMLDAIIKKLPDNIVIEGASVIYDAFDQNYRRDLIDLYINYDDNLNISGSISGVRLPIDFDISIEGVLEGDRVLMNIFTEDIHKVSIEGDMQLKEDSMSFVFDGSGELTDPSQLDALFFSETGIFRKIGYDKPITFAMSGVANSHMLSFSDFSFDSDIMGGEGTSTLGFESTDESDLDLSIITRISNVNLDKLFKKNDKEHTNTGYDINVQSHGFSLPQIKLSLPKVISYHIDAEVDNITYHEKVIKNFAIEADVFSTRAALHRLEITLAGNTNMILNGYVKHNGIRPLFIGNLTAFGESLREVSALFFPSFVSDISDNLMRDFSFRTSINMTPVSTSLEDVLLTFDNASLRGDIGMDYVDTTSIVNISLTLDRFDFDAYGVTSYMLDQVDEFVSSDFRDSRHIEAYIRRNIDSQLRLHLKAEDARFNATKIRRAEAVLSVTPGVWNVDKFIIQDGESEASRKVDVNAYMRLKVPPGGSPESTIYWKSDIFNTRLFDHVNKNTEGTNTLFFWDKPIPYFILDRFDGPITVSIDNLFNKEEKIASNIYFKADTKSRIMTISEMRARLFEQAHVVARARISLGKVTSLGVSYSMLRLPLLRISEAMPQTFSKRLAGDLSVKGKLKTNGLGFREMLSKINVKGDFEIKGLRVENLDLKHIYATTVNTISVVDMKKAIRKGFDSGITEFDTVKGKIQTLRKKEPYQIQLKNVLLQTPYSLSTYAVNYNAVSNAYRSVLNFGFRPVQDKTLKVGVYTFHNKDDDTVVDINDSEVVQFVTEKTESIR